MQKEAKNGLLGEDFIQATKMGFLKVQLNVNLNIVKKNKNQKKRETRVYCRRQQVKTSRKMKKKQTLQGI